MGEMALEMTDGGTYIWIEPKRYLVDVVNENSIAWYKDTDQSHKQLYLNHSI